ncbi:hypothetical protein HNR39_004146 [Glaciimonas immobilis]|uniref:Uncharacterized protein n=1 Tax=Glaciimonas immobilis TaxID=728004 RepID=A0A840RYH7_9BURK|nr:hypothetical protein [Glaciimonas immobilis]
MAVCIGYFLAELASLHACGDRLFKFVDRTFNLNVKTSLRILQFFLDKLEAQPEDTVFAHFELVPNHFELDAFAGGVPENTGQVVANEAQAVTRDVNRAKHRFLAK